MGEEGLGSLRKEESRVERLLQEGKMSVVKLDELRYGLGIEGSKDPDTVRWISIHRSF